MWMGSYMAGTETAQIGVQDPARAAITAGGLSLLAACGGGKKSARPGSGSESAIVTPARAPTATAASTDAVAESRANANPVPRPGTISHLIGKAHISYIASGKPFSFPSHQRGDQGRHRDARQQRHR